MKTTILRICASGLLGLAGTAYSTESVEPSSPVEKPPAPQIAAAPNAAEQTDDDGGSHFNVTLNSNSVNRDQWLRERFDVPKNAQIRGYGIHIKP